MPHSMGHRRAHSYFSGFATSISPFSQISKARSTDQLSEQKLEPLTRATSAKDISKPSSSENIHLVAACKLQVEEELEQKVQSLISKKRYREVTVPNSIKFAVIRPSGSSANMARPRSPSKSSSSSETDLLDQTLLNIRKRLVSQICRLSSSYLAVLLAVLLGILVVSLLWSPVSLHNQHIKFSDLHTACLCLQSALSNNRVEMETRMDNLMTGIKEVHIQYCNQLQQSSISASSIRRAKSTANPARRPSNLSVTKIEEVNSRIEKCSQDEGVDLSQDSTFSASSQGSYSSQPILRPRSESASATVRAFKTPTFSIQRCSMGEDSANCWMPATTIHELPESPRHVHTPLSQSSLSLKSYSPLPTPKSTTTTTTTPKSAELYRRSFSVSSPPSTSPVPRNHPAMVTSTPNVSHPTDRRDYYYYYHTLPGLSNSHRNSLPESTLTSIIPEDGTDFGCTTDSLSQLSMCTDDGSPKSGSSTLVTRRSSLTGQIEEYRKPRSSKNASTKDLSEVAPKRDLPSPSNIYATWTKGDSGYRVLNRGFRKSMKKNKSRLSQIILPSVETTV